MLRVEIVGQSVSKTLITFCCQNRFQDKGYLFQLNTKTQSKSEVWQKKFEKINTIVCYSSAFPSFNAAELHCTSMGVRIQLVFSRNCNQCC